jgi:hypothetical protein
VGFLQKLFSPLGYIGAIVLAILGLDPGHVSQWLTNHMPPEVSTWIKGDQARWTFVLAAILLFGGTEWRRRRVNASAIASVALPTGLPDALAIKVGDIDPYKVINYSDGTMREVVRVEVENTGKRSLANCQLEMERMEPDADDARSTILRSGRHPSPKKSSTPRMARIASLPCRERTLSSILPFWM